MSRFFKKEENRPLPYSSIQMKKNSTNSVWWIGGLIIAIVTLGIFLWIK